MDIVKLLITIVLGYLLGSLSSSVLLSIKAWGGDVRKKGSGNAGATNMARVYGWAAGILTLVCDMAKAGLSVWIGWKLLGDWGSAWAASPACWATASRCFMSSREAKGSLSARLLVSPSTGASFWPSWRCF